MTNASLACSPRKTLWPVYSTHSPIGHRMASGPWACCCSTRRIGRAVWERPCSRATKPGQEVREPGASVPHWWAITNEGCDSSKPRGIDESPACPITTLELGKRLLFFSPKAVDQRLERRHRGCCLARKSAISPLRITAFPLKNVDFSRKNAFFPLK